MPSALATDSSARAPDALDDLFNYDAGMDQVMSESNAPERSAESSNAFQDITTNLDEEVKVTRKRQPIAKLDEERFVPRSSLVKTSAHCLQVTIEGRNSKAQKDIEAVAVQGKGA